MYIHITLGGNILESMVASYGPGLGSNRTEPLSHGLDWSFSIKCRQRLFKIHILFCPIKVPHTKE